MPATNQLVVISQEQPDNQPDSDEEIGSKELGLNLTDAEMKQFKIWPQGVIPYLIDVDSYKGIFSFPNFSLTNSEIGGAHLIIKKKVGYI